MEESKSAPKPKPKLTLKFGRQPSTASAGSPSVSQPTPSSAKTPKVMLRLGPSKASTPIASSAPTLPKSSPQKVKKEQRTRKPSAKVLAENANGKRDHSDSEDDKRPAIPAKKKIKQGGLKISLRKPPTTPNGAVRLKVKGKPPKRIHGEGYDSEASDREVDPAIEEQFVMRFDEKLVSEYGGSSAECNEDSIYIHDQIEKKKIGDGAEITMRFYHPDGRRAAITVRKNHYAATLVDMPTITESMKSFDKKTWMKTADVSQMLLVFSRIPNPEAAKTIELPRLVDRKTYEFPHGLTAPMRYARHRRFRHRTRRNDIEELEREVEALFARDAAAKAASTEWFNPDARSRDTSRAFTEEGDELLDEERYEDENADAEGEVDDSFMDGAVYDQNGDMLNMNGDGEEVDLEDALFNSFAQQPEEMATPATEAATPMVEFEANTPIVPEGASDEESEEDDEEDEEDEEEEEEEMDDETRAKHAAIAEQREDVAELQRKLEDLQEKHSLMQNPILRKRLETTLESTRAELVLKQAALEDING